MPGSFDTRFLRTIADVAVSMLDENDPFVTLAQTAARTGDLPAARQGLDGLPARTRDALLAETHRRLATDLSAIWDQLPGADPNGLQN